MCQRQFQSQSDPLPEPYQPDSYGLAKATLLAQELQNFQAFGAKTLVGATVVSTDYFANITAGRVKTIEDSGFSSLAPAIAVPTYTNEFWTAKQREGHSLHEISYRACFKPQLPSFFIERLTFPGDIVYDPFMGRGTTPLQAQLLNRIPYGCDINPLSLALVEPRLSPPTLEAISRRLQEIEYSTISNWQHKESELKKRSDSMAADLLVFYHPDTLSELCCLRSYFLRRIESHTLDQVDKWLRMVAINRLTGHSPGFFSVYTLPPNQAVSIASQRKINAKRQQVPPYRDTLALIFKKSKQLLKDYSLCAKVTGSGQQTARLLTASADNTPTIASSSVTLIVTSPPFLNVVNYSQDNWLRCWFLGIEADSVPITIKSTLASWTAAMQQVLIELDRVLKPGGYLAFEVGEVEKGHIKLEEAIIWAGHQVGLIPELVLINSQSFTKTSNCWGISNNRAGTNSNRIVLFTKPRT